LSVERQRITELADHDLRQQRLDQILDWFPDTFMARDVRLLTRQCDDEATISLQLAERGRAINTANTYSPGVTLRVQFTLESAFPYVHDRFAIIDDELWHFGATVGGLHERVNAATRGWVADEHCAAGFFEQAWTGDRDVGRTHDKGPPRGAR
jgi:hypothetical protein